MPDFGELEPLLLDAQDVARLLSLSAKTVRRMNAAGRMPRPVQLSPGAIRWRYRELSAWIEAGCPDRAEWEALARPLALSAGRPRGNGLKRRSALR